MLRSKARLPGTEERMPELPTDHLPLTADLDGDQIIERLAIYHRDLHSGPEPH